MTSDPTACKLIPGMFGLVLQLSLGILSLASLLIKKKLEDRAAVYNRTWNEFLLDSSKQIIGGIWLHILNLLFAIRLHRKFEGDSCDWYFANILIDCTLGTGIEYLLLVAATKVVIPVFTSEQNSLEFQSGEYGGTSFKNMTWRCYFKQLGLWLTVCLLMKLAVYSILKTYTDDFLRLAHFFLSPWESDPNKKLAVVMIVSPLIMNTIQLWIVDNILRRDIRSPPAVVNGINKDALLERNL